MKGDCALFIVFFIIVRNVWIFFENFFHYGLNNFDDEVLFVELGSFF